MTETWWGEQSFEEGTVLSWHLGLLHLAVRRTAREWIVAYRWAEDEAPDPGWVLDREAVFPDEGWALARFVFASTDGGLQLVPALADRPVVTSPRVPLFVSPGEETTLFVGSPLWIQIKAQQQVLRELPIQRPSDTWFGPSTREGELCYAARTRAVLDVDNLPLLARRAVTSVSIRNLAESPLPIERLKLPVPYLSLYAADGRVWTEAVSMHAGSSEMAEVAVRPGAPFSAAGAELLTVPREQSDEHTVMRVFSKVGSLFRVIGEDDV